MIVVSRKIIGDLDLCQASPDVSCNYLKKRWHILSKHWICVHLPITYGEYGVSTNPFKREGNALRPNIVIHMLFTRVQTLEAFATESLIRQRPVGDEKTRLIIISDSWPKSADIMSFVHLYRVTNEEGEDYSELCHFASIVHCTDTCKTSLLDWCWELHQIKSSCRWKPSVFFLCLYHPDHR